jgi:ribosomal protein S18 acetylase RimI-like enzyme
MVNDGSEVPHIESVWTDPEHRKRGIATALIRWLVDRYRRLGATEIRLWVLESSPDARRLYESLGFEPTGERQPVDGQRIEERLRFTG